MLAGDAGISVTEQGSNRLPVAQDQGDVDVIVMVGPAPPEKPIRPFEEHLGVPVLFLETEPVDIRNLLGSSTAWGVLPLDSSAGELQAAVRALASGLLVAAPSLASAAEGSVPDGDSGPLTERETEVLALLSRGMANKQIAVALGISEHTVKFHVSSIYTKLNATNRTQAVREGLRHGWIAL